MGDLANMVSSVDPQTKQIILVCGALIVLATLVFVSTKVNEFLRKFRGLIANGFSGYGSLLAPSLAVAAWIMGGLLIMIPIIAVMFAIKAPDVLVQIAERVGVGR